MEVIQLNNSNTLETAAKAASVLRAGGVVLYPTDTLYGLGADALSDEAVAKIFRIKGRDEGKPIHAIVDGLEMAAQYGEISDDAKLLSDELPKGQVTFIVPKRAECVSGITKDIQTFGFRIPDSKFCIEMLRAFAKPITATSANRAGEEPQRSADAILKQLGDTARFIDLVIDAGDPPAGGAARKASSVVDLSGPEPKVLREGAVAAARIESFFSL